MSPDSRPRLQDVHPGVLVRQFDQFPDVDPHPVAEEGKLVCEGDVYVPEGVLDQLGHFGGLAVGEVHVAAAKGGVEVTGLLGGKAVDPPDDPVVFDKFPDDVPRQDPLRAVRDEYLPAAPVLSGRQEVGAKLPYDLADPLRGPHRRGRLQYDQVPLPQAGRDGAGSRLDVGDVGKLHVAPVAFHKGGRHGDDEGVGLLRNQGRLEIAAIHSRADQDVEFGLDDVDLTGVYDLHSLFVDIDAEHVVPLGAEHRGGRQTDVPKPHDHYLLLEFLHNPPLSHYVIFISLHLFQRFYYRQVLAHRLIVAEQSQNLLPSVSA